MGSASSRTKVKKSHRGNQTSPSIPDIKSAPRISTSIPSKSHDPLFVRTPHIPNRRPVSVQEEFFELETNVEEYSSIWDHDAKLSSTFQQVSKSNPSIVDHLHQKETFDHKWSKKTATTVDSAHVESIVDTQTHSCITVSSSAKIDEIINTLNRLHTQLDDETKRRTSRISHETESVLSYILNETQQKQQRLLNYAKEQQMKQDENYQTLLQDYIGKLDEIKANELAVLQKQLQSYREQILEESQMKMMTVNEQANMIKARILQEQQYQASEKVVSLISNIQKISADEKVQQLESEIKTETNIIRNATVGMKASSQTRHFDSHRNDIPGERLQSQKKTTHTTEDNQATRNAPIMSKLKQK